MAIDLSKFKKKVEKKLPILFLVEEDDKSNISADLVKDILNACLERNIHTEFMLFSYGLEWTLKFPKPNNKVPHYANLEGVKLDDAWHIIANITASKQTFLGSALEVSKAILDDPDTTKPGRYKPVVIIIASKIPAQGWEDYFVDLLNNGRSSNAQVYWLNKNRNTDDAFRKAFEAFLPLGPFSHVAVDALLKNTGFDSKCKAAREKRTNNFKKRFEKVIFKNIGSRLVSNYAQELVSSFKLEPLEEGPVEDSVEFAVPGFDGSFGDGTDAKGDGMV